MVRALALALVCIVTAAASAQPADPKENKVDAQSLMQSGVKLLEAKDYLGALAVFKTAYERFPSTKILLNIGTTLKYLDRDADAANAYQRYIDANDAEPKRRAELQKLVDKIDKTTGRYEITPTPSDATVTIDDDDWLHVVRGKLWRVAPRSPLDHRQGRRLRAEDQVGRGQGRRIDRARDPAHADPEAGARGDHGRRAPEQGSSRLPSRRVRARGSARSCSATSTSRTAAPRSSGSPPT